MATEPAKKISLAFGKKPLVKPANGLKRRAAALHDSDDEGDSTNGQHQEISAFDQASGGAVVANGPFGKNGPLVIKALPNHDRLEYGRRKRQRSDLPQEDQEIVISKKEVMYGLLLPDKKSEDSTEPVPEATQTGMNGQAPEQEKSDDQVALEALLGNGSGSTRTIPLADEVEAFRRDMNDAVEAPTLDQYLAIPPSEFGAACLRGMGWKDTETIGTAAASFNNLLKPRPVERRPALLGVGAKPSAALGIEIGEWGKAARGGQKGKEPQGYNPVVLKNKKTGEVLTEEELKAKVAQQGQASNELVFAGDDKAKDSGSRRRDDMPRDSRRDEYNYDSKRDRSYKSDRSDRDRDGSKSHGSDRDRYDKYIKRDKYRDEDRSHSRKEKRSDYYDDEDRSHRSQDDRRDRDRDDRYHKSSSSRKDRDRSERDYDKSSRRQY